METRPAKKVADGAPLRDSTLRSAALLAWLRLARVYQKTDRASAEHLRRWGLTVAQFDVLTHIGAREGLSQQQLADSLLVTKGNVTQLLHRLEHDGLVRRCQEGRVNRLVLTERGRLLRDQVAPAQEALVTRLFSTLPPEKQSRLLALLRELDHALE